MANNVWIRAIHYSVQEATDTWRIDICIPDAVAQILRSVATVPVISFEGLTQDLKPGIFPSSLRFGIMIRNDVLIDHGTSYLPNEALVTSLFARPEGYHTVRAYKNDELQFIGVILPDQCSSEFAAYPYQLNITAVDGLYRLQSEEYISEVGQIEYVTLRQIDHDGDTAFTSTPIAAGLVGTEWILIEHYSELFPGSPFNEENSIAASTYARYEQYATESPGTGWVDQGGGLWAKELSYGNEIVVDEAFVYHLTRDIDNEPMRPLDEYIRRGMMLLPTKDEYGTDVMYDVVNRWYETGMWDLTADPFTMTRWSEKKFAIGQRWSAVCEELLKTHYCRLYYAKARYHFEQIPRRGETTIKRYCYDNTGTLIATEEDVDLDISAADEDIRPDDRGVIKVLAPLRWARVTVDLRSNNLLDGEEWTIPKGGGRYVGSLRMTDADTRMRIDILHHCRTEFGSPFLTMPETLRLSSTAATFTITIRVRATNIDTGTTYHLTPESQDQFGTSTWELDEVDGYFKKVVFVPGISSLPPFNNRTFRLETTSDELPGSVNHTFDIWISINITATFATPAGDIWLNAFPDDYAFKATTETPSMTTVDGDGNAVNANLRRIYRAVNDMDNTVEVELAAKFCDQGKNEDSIEIMSSASPISWRKSREWNLDGEVTGAVEILQLLAQEIISLRKTPKRVFSGAFLTSLMSAENRINYGGRLYLPLNAQIDTDTDKISGDFVHLQRETPPDADVLAIPDLGTGVNTDLNPSGGGAAPGAQLFFETDEVLTSGNTYTQSAIINSLGVAIESGNTVRIVDTATGAYQDLTLTQDVAADDVVMYFASQLFSHTFPDGSLITLVPADTNPPVPFEWSSDSFTGAFFAVPRYYDLAAVIAGSRMVVDLRWKIWRKGQVMNYNANAAGPAQYSTNTAGPLNNLVFPRPFTGESIRIELR